MTRSSRHDDKLGTKCSCVKLVEVLGHRLLSSLVRTVMAVDIVSQTSNDASRGISCGSLDLDAFAGMTDREPRGLFGLTNEVIAEAPRNTSK